MFKKFLLSLIVVTIFCGCASDSNYPKFNESESDTRIILSSDFNQDHYIWENWSFSTNRVDK